MPINLYRCIVLIFIINVFFGMSIGQAEEKGLTLSEALSIAYDQNPEMRIARKNIEALKGNKVTQSAFYGPQVRVDIGGFKSQEINGEKVDPDKEIGEYEIIQPFDAPGVRILRSGIASDTLRIGETALIESWAGVYQRVKNAYAAVLFAQESLSVFDSNLNAARQFRDSVEQRFQSNKASKSENIRARIEVLKSETEILEARKELSRSQTALNLLLGRPIHAPIRLEGKLRYEVIEIAHDEEEALLRRPEVEAQRLRLEAAKKDRLKSRLSFLPEPFIGFRGTRADYDNDYSVLVGAKLPLWDFNLGAIKEKSARAEIEKIRLEAVRGEISDEVHEATLELELAVKKFETQKKATEEGNELLKSASLQYQEGEMSFLQYLENLKTVKEVTLSYFDALRNYNEKLTDYERVTQNLQFTEGAKK